ncbi:MAG: FHA domain-containing protein, partial [Thermoanaerobaculia bacterium]
ETAGRKTRILFEQQKIVWAESSRGTEGMDAVLDAIEWTSGSFTLLDSAAVPANVARIGLDVETLVEEARKRAEQGALYADGTMLRVVEDAPPQVNLTGDDLKILFRLASGKSFRELAGELGTPRKELGERLRHLEQIGLVTATREEPQPVKTDPRLKTVARRRTLVGSLTPDSAPDNVWPLLDSEYTIGRLPSNAISISDGSVSGQHARIVRTPDGFALEDLQSRNGTFVNGERVTERRLLTDGDLIRIGKVIMTFNLARDAQRAETTQPEVRIE